MFSDSPAFMARLLAVPSGSWSRLASTVTWRVRSRRLISAGDTARVKVTRSASGTRETPWRPGTVTLRSFTCVTSARSDCGSRTRTSTPSPASSSYVETACPPMSMATVLATAPLPSPDAAARSRSTIRRYSGRSCSMDASMSTMPGIFHISAFSWAAYFLSVAMSSPWMATASGRWNESGSSRKFSMTPGIFWRRGRALCTNCFTLTVRWSFGTSFTNTVASRTVSASPDPIDA